MKIYTGTGDRGKTSLLNGERVFKHHQRVEAYGDLDELNSVLGLFLSVFSNEEQQVREQILKIQSELFKVGTWLATTDEAVISPSMALTVSMVTDLEKAIDRMEDSLQPLKGFILPGGHLSASIAHMARTVCRRCERHAVRFLEQHDHPSITTGTLLAYLNRLSDYLFVLARYCNRISGVTDILWKE